MHIFLAFVLVVSTFAAELGRKTRNRVYSPIDNSPYTAISQEARDIYNEIVALCKRKFPRGPARLGAYNILNWPIHISPKITTWDTERVETLRQSLSKMECTSYASNFEKSSVRVAARRRLLLDELVKKFQAQIKYDSSRVYWKTVHIFGWPANVNPERFDHFGCSQIDAVFRALPRIRFVPIEGLERRIVTDKTFEEYYGIGASDDADSVQPTKRSKNDSTDSLTLDDEHENESEDGDENPSEEMSETASEQIFEESEELEEPNDSGKEFLWACFSVEELESEGLEDTGLDLSKGIDDFPVEIGDNAAEGYFDFDIEVFGSQKD